MDLVGGVRFSPPRQSQMQRRQQQQQFGQQPPVHQADGDLPVPVLQAGGGLNHQARIGGHGSGRAGVRRNVHPTQPAPAVPVPGGGGAVLNPAAQNDLQQNQPPVRGAVPIGHLQAPPVGREVAGTDGS